MEKIPSVRLSCVLTSENTHICTLCTRRSYKVFIILYLLFYLILDTKASHWFRFLHVSTGSFWRFGEVQREQVTFNGTEYKKIKSLNILLWHPNTHTHTGISVFVDTQAEQSCRQETGVWMERRRLQGGARWKGSRFVAFPTILSAWTWIITSISGDCSPSMSTGGLGGRHQKCSSSPFLVFFQLSGLFKWTHWAGKIELSLHVVAFLYMMTAFWRPGSINFLTLGSRVESFKKMPPGHCRANMTYPLFVLLQHKKIWKWWKWRKTPKSLKWHLPYMCWRDKRPI